MAHPNLLPMKEYCEFFLEPEYGCKFGRMAMSNHNRTTGKPGFWFETLKQIWRLEEAYHLRTNG